MSDSMKSFGTTPNYNKLPKWVKKVIRGIPHHIQTERVGNVWRLIDCAKAWKIAPELPKCIAERVGKMPPWKRVAARVAWEQLMYYGRHLSYPQIDHTIHYQKEWQFLYHSDEKFQDCDYLPGDYNGYMYLVSINIPRSDVYVAFWKQFNELCQMGKLEVFALSGDMTRAIGTMFPTLGRLEALTLLNTISKACEQDPHIKPFTLLSNFKSGAWKDCLEFLFRGELTKTEWGYTSGASQKTIEAICENNWRPLAGLALTLVFGKRWKDWLSSPFTDIRDATNWLPLAECARLSGLADWLFKYKNRPVRELSLISSKWQFLSKKEKNLTYHELLVLSSANEYADVQSPVFAAEASRWEVDESRYKIIETRWLASIDTHMPFPTTQSWKFGTLTGRFLNRNDPRGLFLGQHINCCQHPMHAIGKGCAWHGQESPNGGFFVVEDNEGEIIAQSWVWLSDDGGMCFDNVEALHLGSRQDVVQIIYHLCATDLSEFYHSVTLGFDNSDLDTDCWQECEPLLLPRDYYGSYSDSSMQVILANNTYLPRLVSFDEIVWTRGASKEDLERCEEIAELCFPDEWQFISQGDTKIILQHRDEGIIGYAILCREEQSIEDIAVIPEFRYYTKILIECLSAIITTSNDLWTARCRKSTSFKLMKKLEKRKKIKIESERLSAVYMAEEPMYDIIFSVIN